MLTKDAIRRLVLLMKGQRESGPIYTEAEGVASLPPPELVAAAFRQSVTPDHADTVPADMP